MTSWRKCIKFCAVFIASTLLFQYYVKCDDNYEKSSLSNLNIVGDYNSNLGSENAESLTIIPSKSIKSDLDEALNSQESDGIDSVVHTKNFNKKLGKPSTTKLDDVSKEIKDIVTESLTSTDEIENTQSEKLTNQDNDSNTNDDQQNTQEMEEYDDINIEEIVNSDYSGPSLPDCSEKAEIRDPILVVSTIDGQISGINYETGEVIWSHSTSSEGGPMLSSSMSKLEVSSRGEWVRLIPSLDGGIYRFDGEHVEALPVNADTFLHSSFKFSEDTIFSGGKFFELIGIHPQTGEIKYVCDKNGCPKNRSVADNRPTLVVRRISYNVRAIDPSAGTERWKFSVGRHEVNLAIGNCESLIKDVDSESLPYLHFILPEGNVLAMNKNSEIIWQQKLPSPILSAWSLVNEELETINLFSSTSIPALVPNDRTGEDSVDSKREPSLYVGIHKGQLYVQENINSKEFGSVVQRFINTNAGIPKVQWQPYLATAVSRTPVIHHGSKNHPLLLDYDKKQQTNELVVRHTYDYPFDNGYYLFGEDFEMLLNDSDHWITSEEDDNDEIPPISDSLLHRVYYHFAGRGVMFWELASTIVIIFICNVILFRRLVANNVLNLQRILNDVIFYLIAYILHNIFRENAQVVLIIQRMGLNIAPLAPPPPPATLPALPYESSEEKQAPAVETQRQDSCFSSRYISDYEPIRRLGKGGFGVVFQVKNKLDQNEYAVKRILLPSKESSAERVKREARALAKLDHTNIVRYFTSWLETPPLGWEEEADLWWKRSETLSQSLTEGEDEYSEQPCSEDVDNQGVQTERQPSLNNQLSLSAVINKLNYNSELNIPPLKSIDSKKSSLCDDSSHSNSFGSDDDEDNEDDKEEFSDEETSANYSNNDDSSFDILFEDTEVDQMKECTKQGIINKEAQKDGCKITENNNSKLISKTRESSYSDSIVFENNSTEYPHEDPNMLKGKTRESDQSDSIVFENRRGESIHDDSIDFTSRTSESAHSDSILFANSSAKKEVENENRKEGSKRIKSSSFSVAPSRQILKRRRINTHTGLTDHKDRPSSLVLKDVNKNSGNKYDNKKSTENQPSSCNPRTYLYIQMELCQTSSLKDWLSINKIRDTEYMYSIFNDIVHAVEYVHDLALMHRDLKPSNIFFSLDGKIKIGDFGLVTTIEEESDALTPMIDDSSIQKTLHGQQQKTRNVGTTLYMSPEQFSGLSYTYKVDIFSLGLIFFEMLVPFSTEMERIDVMRKARDKQFPPEFCKKYPDVKDLLQLALHENPNERLTTRGLRARKPLHSLQKDSENISSDEHFNLTRLKGHIRSSSGSFSFMHSTSVST